MKRKSIVLETLGCKLNQAETEALARQLAGAGYELAESGKQSDIYVLNTCTVTHVADRKTRHLLRLARHRHPWTLVVALGCYSQRASQELAQTGLADLVLGNSGKHLLLEALEAKLDEKQKGTGSLEIPSSTLCPRLRTRTMVKIQDGCNQFCSFCVVPYVRGREHSIPPEQVIAEVRARAGEGYREIVLTGTNMGSYGRGLAGASLKQLIQRLLTETGVERLRLSSLQPQDLTPDLLELWDDQRLCRHLHIPLQSGCDRVLEIMNRPYSIAEYETAISLAREAIPGLAVTTDIMVGFPQESEEEFEESYLFCQKMRFANMHVFPYSARRETVAAKMPHQVEDKAKARRKDKMLELAHRLAYSFRQDFLDQTMSVLWEQQKEKGIWSGLTDNYIRVFAESKENLANRLLPVKLTGEYKQGLCGKIM